MNNSFANKEKGSTMLAALCFSTVVAISLGSYVAISLNTMQQSDNVVDDAEEVLDAENALEETLDTVTNENFADWTVDGDTASQTITGIDLKLVSDMIPVDFVETITIIPAPLPPTPPTRTQILFNRWFGTPLPVQDPVESLPTVDPTAIDMALTGINDGSDIRTLTLTQRTNLNDGSMQVRTLTAVMTPLPAIESAVVAKNTIRFRRDGVIDSYNSAEGAYNPNNSGFEATLSGKNVLVSRADVKGFASTTGNRTPSFGSRASLQGPQSVAQVDTSRFVATPFQAQLESVPASGAGSQFSGPGSSLGTANSVEPRIYYARNVELNNADQITITGPTILVVDGNLTVSDRAKIVIAPEASLEIHVDGYVSIAGNGVDNQSRIPSKFALIGTSSDTTEINLNTTTPLYGAIYAPQADIISYTSGTTIFGAIVSNSASFNEKADLHFDVALRNSRFSGIETAFAFSR